MIILKAENISKQYRLGLVGTGTLSHDLNRLWSRIRGKEDPYLKIGGINDRASKVENKYVWALKNINFEVKKGEVLGIIGKNGAGKSTLLKILSRVTSPTTGVIKTKGRIASLLEVGTGFHPELTGRENIYLNGAILGMTKAEIKAKEEEIIDFSGCQMYIDTPVKRYSSGMRVRLAFAVAAHLEPDILVVDEVLAVGDAEFQKKAIGKMQDISKGEGRTVLFVSHNMAAVKSLCTRGIVLEHGVSVFEGTADEAVDFYFSNNLNIESVDLWKREDRRGNGNFKFTEIKFLNSNHKQIQEIISGEKLIIEISFEIKDEQPMEDVVISLIFRDNNRQTITSFLSDEIDNRHETFEGQKKILLQIDEINLRGQTYEIMLLSFNQRTKDEYALDILEDAAFFTILQGDINCSGILDRPGYSSIIDANYTWL